LQGLVSFLRISYFMLIHHDSTYSIAYKFDVSFHAKQITRASHPERQGRVHCQVKGFGYWCQPPLHSLNDEFITQIKCLLGNRLPVENGRSTRSQWCFCFSFPFLLQFTLRCACSPPFEWGAPSSNIPSKVSIKGRN
jgi:hypothetical protein